MRNRNGYGTYHGKSGFRTFLKVLIALLLVVLLLMLAGFFVLEKYMVYDADGARLVLPFLQSQGQAPQPETSTPLVVETPDPEPTPTPAPDLLHAVELPRAALTDGSAAAQVSALGGNAALFDMKADDGTLGYVSAVPLAIEVGASASDPGLNAAIQTLNGGELYSVARVSCFRDNLAPYKQNKLAIKTNSGYNWRDQDEIRWTSPTNETARQYVVDVCLELAGLGFDEILLDCAGYPTGGNLGYIKKGDAYNKDQFQPVVSGFYAQVRQALSAYPQVKLSIVTTEATLTGGSDPLSGQSVTGLIQSAHRVWAPLTESSRTQCVASLRGAGMAAPETALVSIAPQAGGGDGSWAVLPVGPEE